MSVSISSSVIRLAMSWAIVAAKLPHTFSFRETVGLASTWRFLSRKR